MWFNYSREQTWTTLPGTVDMVIIGGGITGAGIFREASRLGLSTLLVEKNDFAWGTSSASSKMVHGGLRYLKEGDLGITIDSVRERKRLLQEASQLIKPLNYILPIYKGEWGKTLLLKIGLGIYDLIGKQWLHGQITCTELAKTVPHLKQDGLKGGFWFQDAVTDDARLVLNVIQEGLADGGLAVNYCLAESLIWEKGLVKGVKIINQETQETKKIKARVVINATGVWAAQVCDLTGQTLHLRPLRGSHLIFPRQLLPVPASITLLHPLDKRPLFVFPWQGRTVVGTTDLDHDQDLGKLPFMSKEEQDYLLFALRTYFPEQYPTKNDLISSYAGVRPIVSHGNRPPSKEPRKHIVKDFKGMITVTGGKLTTFRLIAHDALRAASPYLGKKLDLDDQKPIFSRFNWHPCLKDNISLTSKALNRLKGRFRMDCPKFLVQSRPNELSSIADTDYLLAELRWSVAHEGILHLDDLLLRRTRLGLILPNGARDLLGHCKEIFAQELNWDEKKWQQEMNDYNALWKQYFWVANHG